MRNLRINLATIPVALCLRSVLIVGCFAFATLLISPRAYADGFTLAGPTGITLTEDGAPHDFLYTLTNNTVNSLPLIKTVSTAVQPGLNGGFSAGDPTDARFTSAMIGFGVGGANCISLASLASGSSCTVGLELQPNFGVGETVSDSAISTLTLFIALFTPRGQTPLAAISVTEATNDLPIQTPEPSSLMLLGSGVVSMVILWRRLVPASTSL